MELYLYLLVYLCDDYRMRYPYFQVFSSVIGQMTTCLWPSVNSSWNVMAHGDARDGKWRGNWRMEWVASTLRTISEHSVSSITTADAHTSAASSQLNWHPRRFKWTRPFRRKTKSGFCACTVTFQTHSTFWWLNAPSFRRSVHCHHEDGGSKCNRNVGTFNHYTEQKPWASDGVSSLLLMTVCKNVLFEAILLAKVCVRHIVKEIHIFHSSHYSSPIVIEAYKRTQLCQIDSNIIKATPSYFGPKHVGVGVFYTIPVNLMQLCGFVCLNCSSS